MDDRLSTWAKITQTNPVISGKSMAGCAIASQIVQSHELEGWKLALEDWRDWMPYKIFWVNTQLRCFYVNVNPKSQSYDNCLSRDSAYGGSWVTEWTHSGDLARVQALS